MMVRQMALVLSFAYCHISEICSFGLKINDSSLMPLMYITVLRFCFLSSNISFFFLTSAIYFD